MARTAARPPCVGGIFTRGTGRRCASSTTVVLIDRIERTKVFRRGLGLPEGGYVGFTDDIFSANLDLILQSGPESPLQFERFDGSGTHEIGVWN